MGKNINEVKNAYNFNNLQSFLDIYYQAAKVLVDEKDFFGETGNPKNFLKRSLLMLSKKQKSILDRFKELFN